MCKRAALISLVMLSGCSGPLGFRPTMEADAPISGGEGIMLANGLRIAYTSFKETDGKNDESPCPKTKPGYQERDRYEYRRYTKSREDTSPFTCMRFKRLSDYDGDQAKFQADVDQYLSTGLALSDYYCETFFRRIALHSASRKFARSGVNDAGTAVSLVLGLAAAGSATTGGVGAGFGLVESFFKNYDDAFLVASDLPRLETAVLEKQEEYRFKLSKATISSFEGATSAILRHAYYCSFTGMRSLINEKLATRENLILKGFDSGIASNERVRAALDGGKKTGSLAADARKAEPAPKIAENRDEAAPDAPARVVPAAEAYVIPPP